MHYLISTEEEYTRDYKYHILVKMRQHKISDVAKRSNWGLLDLKSIQSVQYLTLAFANGRFTAEKQKNQKLYRAILPSQQVINPWECFPHDSSIF